MEFLNTAMVWGSVALGLGFVIFIHELGHFFVAKWNGVKVELFSLGFGPVLVAFRKGVGVRFGSTWPAVKQRLAEAEAKDLDPETLGLGETEYSIRAVPLGGFVKMLGEGEGSESEEVKSADPRAYPNKPVGARMAIISAGVIMNAILGLVVFSVVYGQGGLMVMPARIGAVVPGNPAYDAGLRAGDEVLTANGRGDMDYMTLKRVVAMSGSREVLHLSVNRPGVEQPLSIDVEPRRQAGSDHKTIGILPFEDLTLAAPPEIPGTPLQKGDRIVAVGVEGQGPQPVADRLELNAQLSAHRDQPLIITAERPAAKRGGPATKVTATLPVTPFVDLGLRMTLGPIVAIQPGSPAAKAGFRVGDRIVAIADDRDLDPMRLPDRFNAIQGTSVTVTVSRTEGGKPPEDVALTVTPDGSPIWTRTAGLILDTEALDVPGLGLACAITPKIAAVRPGSPAEHAGLAAGDTLADVALIVPSKDGKKPAEPKPRKLEGENALTWLYLFATLQAVPDAEVQFTVAGRSSPVLVKPAPDPEWSNASRNLQLEALEKPLPPLATGQAIRRGVEESLDAIFSIFAFFRSLASGDISPKTLVGPVGIVGVAAHTARSGWQSFFQFLGILSLNLAVVNFLPIPPLDGGQMFFLIAEKLRGKPLPDQAVNAGSILGLVLVLFLMCYVLVQDINRLWPF